MIPKLAIGKAISGGWKPPVENWLTTPHWKLYLCQIALDPTFWQSLFPVGQCHCGKDGHPLNSINCPADKWLWQAKEFYDLILTGQPTEPFWAELLKD